MIRTRMHCVAWPRPASRLCWKVHLHYGIPFHQRSCGRYYFPAALASFTLQDSLKIYRPRRPTTRSKKKSCIVPASNSGSSASLLPARLSLPAHIGIPWTAGVGRAFVSTVHTVGRIRRSGSEFDLGARGNFDIKIRPVHLALLDTSNATPTAIAATFLTSTDIAPRLRARPARNFVSAYYWQTFCI